MPQLAVMSSMAHWMVTVVLIVSMISSQCITASAGRRLEAVLAPETASGNSNSSVPAPSQKLAAMTATAAVPSVPAGSAAAILSNNESAMASHAINRLSRPSQVHPIPEPLSQQQDQAEPDALVSAAAAAPPPQGMDSMYTKIFNLHNRYRARHKAQPLTWSTDLAKQAARHAARCDLTHEHSPTVTDNLFAISDTYSPSGYLTAAIQMWYAEKTLYNYAKPDFTPGAGHFTQVVWRESKRLGCAVKVCPNGIQNSGMTKGTIVVCKYMPPGNERGFYAENVLPAASVNKPRARPPPKAAAENSLPPGTQLTSPSCLLSKDKRFQLCLKESGLLVLMQVDIRPNVPMWSSSSHSSMTKPFTATVKSDGVLTVFDSQKRLVWQSAPAGNKAAGPFSAVLQNDGLLAVVDARGTKIWDSQSAM